MRAFELVIPAYNEAATLKMLMERTIRAAEDYKLTPDQFGLILVDNGSTDQTADVLAKFVESTAGNWFKVVRVAQNQGYGHGIVCGLASASAEFVGWSHADLQCDPQDAFRAYNLLQESADLKLFVKGRRSGRRLSERSVSFLFALLSKIILGLHCSEINAQPKVFHRSLLPHILSGPKDFNFDLNALYQAQRYGWKFREIDVHFPPRVSGVSHWSAHWKSRMRTMWRSFRYICTLWQNQGVLWKH